MTAAERFLSPSWYRVAGIRPRLRESAQVQRHRYRGSAWYIIRDTVKGRVHRLAPAAYAIVAAMDGRQTLDALWTESAELLGEEAPTQEQVIQLMGQLHAADLLTGSVPPDARELFERRFKQERAQILQKLLSPLSLKVKLFDPDRFLERTAWLARPFFGWVGALIWLATVLPALALVAGHWPELSGNAGDRLLSVDNLVLMAVVYPLIKTLHELGHGYAAKVFGGRVPEIGVMFLVFFPIPYVDATDAAGFRGKWRRVIVGAAGMLVELFLAALATYVWVMVEQGAVRAIAFNVMFTAGVSTVLFNGNPLMRYDGYYILADLLEIPNLAQRGGRYWSYLVNRYVFRTDGIYDFAATTGERVWFALYTPLAFVYRLTVMLGIALFLAGKYLVIGLILGLWGCISSLILPLGKGLWYVLTNPTLARNRTWAVGVTGAATATVVGALLWLPVPLHTITEGVLWLPESAIVRAGSDGFVTALRAHPGSTVRVGDPLIEADDPDLRAQVAILSARVTELRARLASQRFNDRVEAAVTEVELRQATEELARYRDRAAHLVSRADDDGVLVIDKPDDLVGRFVKQGDIIAYVLPRDGARLVRATIAQDDIDLVRHRLRQVDVKLVGLARQTFDARLLRETPAGSDQLPSRALGSGGGGANVVDPRDQKGTRVMQRIFDVDLELLSEPPRRIFGGRAIVRFEHGWESLGTTIYRRVRQLLLARIQG